MRTGHLALPIVLVISGLVWCGDLLAVRINWTDSMPRGLYGIAPVDLRRGEWIALCVPNRAAEFGRVRGYLAAGACPGGVQPIAKCVAAVSGDEVELRAGWIAVNGEVVDRTPLRAMDTLGRPLPHFSLGRYDVSGSVVWVLGVRRERSWDSRYFGPVPIENVIGTVRPLLTLGRR